MSPAFDRDEDQVLDDFLSEAAQDRATLERYLKLYPDHAGALLDLFTTLTLQPPSAQAPGAEADEAWVDSAVVRLRNRLRGEVVNPFQPLTAQAYNAVRTRLGIRSATLAGFRDRQVELSTVPVRWLRKLAEVLGTSLGALETYLGQPPRLAAQSYRADAAPQAAASKISFEALLAAANEPAETRSQLLSEFDE